jgi:nicotinamide-nucleotide amidase
MKKLVKKLTSNHLTLASAESLTGGMFGEQITSLSGASKVFLGGVITYSTESKNNLLKTTSDIAVSEQTVQEMAEGVKRIFESDIGVACTGVAGPDPQDGQEVGTVFIAVSFSNLTVTKKLDYVGQGLNREQIRTNTCKDLIDLIHSEVF